MSSKGTICRVCLQEGNIPIYGNEHFTDVSEDLNSLANIKVTQDDTFPKHLCYNCHLLLQSAVELRGTATHSDAVLQGHIVTNYGTLTSESSTESDRHPSESPDLCFIVEDDDPEEKVKVESTCDAKQTFDVEQIYTKECKKLHKKPFKSKTRNQIKPLPYKNLLLNIHKVDMNTKSESDVNLTPQLQSLQARLVRPTNLEPQSTIQPPCGSGPPVSVNEVMVSKASSNANVSRKHEKTHTVREKPFQCGICEASFTMKNNLKEHLEIHKGPKFKCNMCENRYSYQLGLKNHIKVVHAGGIRDQICQICGAGFMTRNEALKHERKIHKRDMLPKGRRPCYLSAKYQSEDNLENKI